MIQFKNPNKARKGYTLILVLIVLVVLSTVSLSLLALSRANVQQASAQEENMRAHYLARSGVDITYEALMQNDQAKWKQFMSDSKTLEDTLVFDEIGSVKVQVTKDSEWVQIKATGTTVGHPKVNTATLTFSIKQSDFKITKWENR